MIEQKYSAKQKSINNVTILLAMQMLIPIILIVMIIAVRVIVTTTTTKIVRDTIIKTTRMFLLRIRIVINSPEKTSALHAGAFELEQ